MTMSIKMTMTEIIGKVRLLVILSGACGIVCLRF